MQLKKTSRKQPLPKSYILDLESRVFGELGIAPERSKTIALTHTPKPWAIAASFLLLTGGLWYFTNRATVTSIDQLNRDQIAGYLSNDYEAERYLDSTINVLGNEMTLGWHEAQLTEEAVSQFLTVDSDIYWMTEMNENISQ